MRGRNKASAFARIFNERGYTVGVEVGVFVGYFSSKLIRRMPNLKMLYCIDPWERDDGVFVEYIYKQCLKALEPYMDRCEVIIAKSPGVADRFDEESLDFVYVDGEHTYEACKADVNAWFPKIRHGGILCGDDFMEGWGAKSKYFATGRRGRLARGVIKAVSEFVKEKDKKIGELHILEEDKLNWWFEKR